MKKIPILIMILLVVLSACTLEQQVQEPQKEVVKKSLPSQDSLSLVLSSIKNNLQKYEYEVHKVDMLHNKNDQLVVSSVIEYDPSEGYEEQIIKAFRSMAGGFIFALALDLEYDQSYKDVDFWLVTLTESETGTAYLYTLTDKDMKILGNLLGEEYKTTLLELVERERII